MSAIVPLQPACTELTAWAAGGRWRTSRDSYSAIDRNRSSSSRVFGSKRSTARARRGKTRRAPASVFMRLDSAWRSMLVRALRWTRGRLRAPSDLAGANGGIPPGHEELTEGLARVIFRSGEVFYNPAQVVNRDLSVLVLRWLQRERGGAPLRVLEALSATGLRAIRYASEVPNVSSVVANDLDPNAVETIARNVAHNGEAVREIVVPNCGDAVSVMTAAREPSAQFDVVDLDPYGGACPFLDSAVQAVADGGVLAVTCTDLAVLCGNSPEICFARYGATPLKGPSGHEMAVRIVLLAINAAANRHGRSIEALFCVKIDFYVRLFVRVRDSKAVAQLSQSRTCLVYQCSSCGTQRFQPLGRIKEVAVGASRKRKRRHSTGPDRASVDPSDHGAADGDASGAEQKKSTVSIRKFAPAVAVPSVSAKCSVCDGTMNIGGPIWADALVNKTVCDHILEDLASGAGAFQARDRVDALVRVAAEEVVDAPLFMQLNSMCRVLQCNVPPSASVRTLVHEKGHCVSQSHTDPQALKTTAPPELLWDTLRLWCKTQTKKSKGGDTAVGGETSKNGPVQSTGRRILSRDPELVTASEVDFSVKKDKYVRGGTGGGASAPRFLPNPEPNWGPKARAGKRRRAEGEECA